MSRPYAVAYPKVLLVVGNRELSCYIVVFVLGTSSWSLSGIFFLFFFLSGSLRLELSIEFPF